MKHDEVAFERLTREAAVWVTVAQTQGSVPRDAATWMAVFADAVVGTIGGGHVELQAIGHARDMLAGLPREVERRFALGPSLGQCCGGVMHLAFEPVQAASLPMLRQPLPRVRLGLMLASSKASLGIWSTSCLTPSKSIRIKVSSSSQASTARSAVSRRLAHDGTHGFGRRVLLVHVGGSSQAFRSVSFS